jgi:thermitase
MKKPNSSQSTDSQPFYYADGEKVPLVPSQHFVAVRSDEKDGGTASHAASGIAESFGSTQQPVRVIDLPQYNLTVIAVPDALDSRAEAPAASVRAAVARRADVKMGPPVYETADAPAREALIPVGEILVRFKADSSPAKQRSLLEKLHLQVRREDYPEPGTTLAATSNGGDTVDLANKLHESDEVEFAQPNFVHLTPRLGAAMNPTMGTLYDRSGSTVGDDELVMEGARPEVRAAQESVEPVAPPAAGPTATVSDPAFASQWNLRKIKAPESWDITMGSSAISVAVIDEGCDLTHEDITFRTPGYDAYAGDNTPQPVGNDAHGTACSGIVAMRPNNGRGGAGVAPNCRVLPIRIAQGIGGGFWDTTDAKVADGIRTAVNRGADVLSNSYGLGASTVVSNAFRFAQTNGRGGKGCPIAAATGNGDVRGVIYPANLSPTIPGFLAVGASNEWDQRKSKTSLDGENWWGSNFGPEVDVVAPGVHIYASDIMGAAGYGSGNYAPAFNGTSSATPHVAGLMALILSVDADLRSWEVEDIIKLTADDFGTAGRDEQFGFGRINCRRALEAASRLWYEVTVAPQFFGTGRECFMRLNVRMYNPGINSVRLDTLTVTSHSADGSAEIDRLEYRPNPGGVMAPRSNQDLRLNSILLKANGNQSAWSYRWALNWTYTFWRPSAAAFALSATQEPVTDSGGQQAAGRTARGGAESTRRQTSTPSGTGAMNGDGEYAPTFAASNGVAGDSIAIDRQQRTITITVR